MQRSELSSWLRLLLTDGVGNETARKLMAAFGLPERIFEQSLNALGQIVSERQARSLQTIPEGLEAQIQTCERWLSDAPKGENGQAMRAIVTLGDALYPKSLLSLSDPPLVVWLQGRIDYLLEQGWPSSISMVGSRNPSPQGEKNAEAFAHNFAEAGLCVISGLALGIDAAAHYGALKSTGHGLCTLAVVGTGLDRVYPKQNLALAHQIAAQGLLLSEFPLGVPPVASNFPKRNRVIAALGLGTLVVEAAVQSGSLITARESIELGKDVFAIPGSIHMAQSKGCHALIKQGAKLVESANDVLDELRFDPVHTTFYGDTSTNQAAPTALTTSTTPHHQLPISDHPVLVAMGADPVAFDALLARVDLETAELQVALLELELAQSVTRLPGGLYQAVV